MKFSSLLIIAALTCTQFVMAYTEQYKVFDSGKRAKTCRTNVVNITNERNPLFCTYVFTPYADKRDEGTLLFEFLLNPDNQKSIEIKNQMVAVLKGLKAPGDMNVCITLTLSDGEELRFDASGIRDWTKDEWHQLLMVSYDKATAEWRTQIMLPLEQLISSQSADIEGPHKRHKYVLQKLQNFTIKMLRVSADKGADHIELSIPFNRPTDGTFSSMIKRCK